ncbi:MAG: CBS domain-containing protein [Rhodospirillales bacterium]
MLCRDVMTPNPPTLLRDDTIATAVEMLLLHRTLALPVVEAGNTYVGVFAKSRLLGLLLPAIVAAEQPLLQFGPDTLSNLSELEDQLPQMRKRLAAISDYLVEPCADTTVPVVAPDWPVVTAVLMVFRTRNFVPVVEPTSGELVGMISTWDAIANIRAGI